MDRFDLQKREVAETDALTSRISRLQDEVASLQEQIDATADLNALAAVCEATWQEMKAIDIVLHEVLVHDHPNPDPLAPLPTDGIAECVNGAFAQVRSVMADEYELDIARKRLHMACALGGRALESLATQIEAIVAARMDAERHVTS